MPWRFCQSASARAKPVDCGGQSTPISWPISETRTRITQIIWSDHPAFVLLKPFIAAGARAFLRQDGDMVNLQNQGLKYDPSMLWIDDADRQAKWYQQLKREWAASRREGRAFANPVEPVTLRWKS